MGVLGAKEYGNGLAQANCEELKASLVIEIDRCTDRLYGKLEDIMATTTCINDRLLSPALDKKQTPDIKKSTGWLEAHLEKLEVLFQVSNNIIENVSSLEIETKTDTK